MLPHSAKSRTRRGTQFAYILEEERLFSLQIVSPWEYAKPTTQKWEAAKVFRFFNAFPQWKIAYSEGDTICVYSFKKRDCFLCKLCPLGSTQNPPHKRNLFFGTPPFLTVFPSCEIVCRAPPQFACILLKKSDVFLCQMWVSRQIPKKQQIGL